MDSVRWSPSPQGISVVGTALATFVVLSRKPSVSPRNEIISLCRGFKSSHIIYKNKNKNKNNSAVEN